MRDKLLSSLVALGLLSACPEKKPEINEPTPDAVGKKAPEPAKEPTKEPAKEPMAKSPYPATRAENIEETLFGQKVSDPFRWLEDVKNPEVQAWMSAQDSVTRAALEKIPGRDALAARLKELYYVDSISAPAKRGNRYFFRRSFATKEKSIVYWKEGPTGEEKVLLDPNEMSKDGTTSLGTWIPTYDGKTVAYALRENAADEATLYVMDVATGKKSEIDTIQGAKYASPSWTPKGDGFYYTYLPTDPSIPVSERPGYAEVRFHKLGTDPKSDPVIREKTGDPTKFIGAYLSRDGRWLFLDISSGWSANDVYYRDLKSKDTAWKPFVVGKPALFSVAAWKDQFYVTTNENAPKYKVFKVDPKKTEPKDWKEIIPQDKDAVIDGVQIVGGLLGVSYLKNASSQLSVFDLNGKKQRDITLPEIGSVGGFAGDPDEDEAYYSFNSYLRSTEIYKVSMKSGKSELWNKVKLPINPDQFTVEQVWYPSTDGTKVSMFIVQKKDAPKDGTMPFLLYGYGGFNVSLTPGFSSGLYPWLEAGGGYAVANLRGGAEYGEEWHQAGMRGNKQNVFNDFISAAEFLVSNKYTTSQKLAIQGGSNGGLLVGAAMTQRPDLFRAVICGVPLLDMIRYTKYGSGKTWIDEYGDPEREADFKWLYAYSPYHHVKKGTKYPALLMASADSDDRVDPMHARKFIAQIQANSSSGMAAYLRVEKNAGHGGADLIKQRVQATVDQYSFLMQELGMLKK
jgi:prolyl oligopeptidase